MHFFKFLLGLIVCGFMLTMHSASGQSHDDIAREIQRISEERKRHLLESGMLDDLAPLQQHDNTYRDNARALSTQSMLDMSDAMVRYGFADETQAAHFTETGEYGISDDLNTQEPRQMYVSFSMGEANLKAAIQSAAEQGAVVFFNGLKPGDRTIDDMMSSIHQIIEGMGVIPNIRFNPYGFEYFGITQAPTLTYSQNGYTTLVSGILSFDWLEQQHLSEGSNTDFGVQGPVNDVAERNLLDEIEERYNALDMERQKEQAIARFWQRQQFQHLPSATENDVWHLDPTVRVNEDITNGRGEVLARAGTVVNPLQMVPIQSTYITFDATDTDQVSFVRRYLTDNTRQGRIMLIASRIDQSRGWEHLQALRDDFEREIFMLQREMVSRFQLNALPSVITTDLETFTLKIEQFAVRAPENELGEIHP